MNDKIKGIIIGALIVLVLLGAYIGFNYLQNKTYSKGVQDGATYFNNQIKSELSKAGYLTYYQTYENKTYSIKLVPYGNWTEVKWPNVNKDKRVNTTNQKSA